MNHEKFNDAMCKLRQAEENFNKALQDVAAAINETERKPQKFRENNDKDLNEALHILAAEDGMSVSELNDAFGICSICGILLEFTPEEIIDKVNQWKAKKDKEEQELHVGDEIEYMYPGREPEKCIVIGLDDGIADEKIIWTIGLNLSQRTWFSTASYYGDSYRKTGKHYDSIPIPEMLKP